MTCDLGNRYSFNPVTCSNITLHEVDNFYKNYASFIVKSISTQIAVRFSLIIGFRFAFSSIHMLSMTVYFLGRVVIILEYCLSLEDT